MIDISHIAKLANLPLTGARAKEFVSQLEETIKFINHLKEVKTNGIEPTSQVTGKANEMRGDEITPGLSQQDALKNAPRTHNGFFVSKTTWE